MHVARHLFPGNLRFVLRAIILIGSIFLICRSTPAFATAAQKLPLAPLIGSDSHPRQDVWYTSPVVHFSWLRPRRVSPAGATVYAYGVDQQADASAVHWRATAQRQATIHLSGDGLWYLHVRAHTTDGHWTPIASYAVHIDQHPPTIIGAVFQAFQFNPQYDTERVRLTFAGDATVHAEFVNQQTGHAVRVLPVRHVVAGHPIHEEWDGRDWAAHHVPAGKYRLVLRAIDPAGQVVITSYSDLIVSYKRIVISLRLQRLWAFVGQQLVLTTLVTTGNNVLPTPVGIFHVWGRFHPYTFISPWPKTSIDYYPPSSVSYALYFRQGGYFIHDTSWRTFYGPGSNSGAGVPGQSYTGSHGCVNVPPAMMAQLFVWATTGTPVQIVT